MKINSFKSFSILNPQKNSIISIKIQFAMIVYI